MTTNYDFSKVLLDDEDKAVVGTDGPLYLSQVLRKTFLSSGEGDLEKITDWVDDLRKTKSLSLDTSDANKVKAFISGKNGLTNLAKIQLLHVFKNSSSSK